ncbi:CBS domain-containing protein [Halovenus sp. WSH3]|uniref:CBS domain-containing protein n=1 Tax=Halovenus carboxidivorans TaxID=2692199 RepID=A0A6B0SZR6_9EURY|nr:CBS domain-containing protein [Halovenus carboxidivorans]MXR51194.1 CBS domain-containing protein [Halovenus carboxidivorans]
MGDTPVEQLMTEPVLTVNPGDRVGDVGEAMLQQGIKSVVVIDDQCRPEGILTSTDFIEIATDGPEATNESVADRMTTDIYTVSTDKQVEAAAELMITEGISHLPVVDDREVVGILSMTDIVAGRPDLPEPN